MSAMSLDEMRGLLGQKVYALRVGQVNGSSYGNYSYRIYPVEMEIAEIRLGEARREADAAYYGPGFVTWLCQNTKGVLYAFSPVRDEILGNTQVAGRNTRAFLNAEDLYAEAEILRELVLSKYKGVSRVEIALSAEKPLDAKLADAKQQHASQGFGTRKEERGTRDCMDK